jgi:hypothetical protein
VTTKGAENEESNPQNEESNYHRRCRRRGRRRRHTARRALGCAHAGPQCPAWYGVSLYNINECVPLEVMVAQHCADARTAPFACENERAMVTVTKTQSLPGVGPTDDGGVLVALAAHEQPTHSWWPWALGGGVLVIAMGLVAWLLIRRKPNADLTRLAVDSGAVYGLSSSPRAGFRTGAGDKERSEK